MADTGEDVATLFEDLGDLEKDFAKVELDARKSMEINRLCAI